MKHICSKILKKHFLAILFIPFSCLSVISCRTVKPGIVITADRANLLLAGLENPITIWLFGYRQEEVVVTVTGGGTIKPVELHGGTYVIKPEPDAREIKVEVHLKRNSKLLSTMLYRVRKLPPPQIYFGSRCQGEISKGEVATVHKISARCQPWFEISDVSYIVNYYKITIMPTLGYAYTETVTGDTLSEKTRNLLTNIKKGDMIFITNATVTGPYGATTNELLWLVVK